MFEIITIGSATQDIFVESDSGSLLEYKGLDEHKEFICYEYGAKVEVDHCAFEVGGGAVNTAVNFANLGFHTSTIIKIGNDASGKVILNKLEKNKIDTSLVIKKDNEQTGFSIILTSFEGDRTVLAYRGANGTVKEKELPWDAIKQAKWIYVAPLNKDSNKILDKLSQFAEEHGVQMAYNPGTTALKKGLKYNEKIISTAEVLIMNKTEASLITGINEQSRQISFGIMETSVLMMLKKLMSYNPKMAVITDGKNGVNAYDGDTFYHAPVFPAEVKSTLGAGDAFASTFVASLIKFNWDVKQALEYASVNSAAIVSSFGAQAGLKTFAQLHETLLCHPEFKVKSFKE